MAKYPENVLRTNLRNVYVLGRLSFSGVRAGGTNSSTAVYIVKNARYSPAATEQNFHAEFSSILLRNFPRYLDRDVWRQINPTSFVYRGSGVQAIKSNQAALTLSDALHEDGFINEYAKASVEEDFNSFAGRLFIGNAALWSAAERFPKVNAKLVLVIAFYGQIDSHFTPEFFSSIRDRS